MEQIRFRTNLSGEGLAVKTAKAKLFKKEVKKWAKDSIPAKPL